MDTTTQIILFIMVTVLGITLIVVGILVVFLLKDLRGSISKINFILDDVGKVSDSFSKSTLVIEDSLSFMKQSIENIKEQVASPIATFMGILTLISKFNKKGGDKHVGK